MESPNFLEGNESEKKNNETKNNIEEPDGLESLVNQGVEDLNNEEAFKKLEYLGIEDPEEFISFLRTVEITEDEYRPTTISPWTNTPKEEFDVYNLNLNPCDDSGIHGKNKKHDIAHEFGHVIQKYLKEKKISPITSLDERVLELIPYMNSSLPYFERIIEDISNKERDSIIYNYDLPENYPDLFKNSILNEDQQTAKNLLYFLNANGGLERLAFLRETRQALLNSEIINSFQEKITISKLQHLSNSKEPNRILSFLDKDEKALGLLAEILNLTP